MCKYEFLFKKYIKCCFYNIFAKNLICFIKFKDYVVLRKYFFLNYKNKVFMGEYLKILKNFFKKTLDICKIFAYHKNEY